MDRDVQILKHIYDRFNARDIDGVLGSLADDVIWANGMDGGHVHGREAVRDYWTRQWTIVDSHVEPVSFRTAADGSIVVTVEQSVSERAGRPPQSCGHHLESKTVGHVFHLLEQKVTRFDIVDAV